MILQEAPGGGEPDGRPPERGRRMAIIVTVLGVVIALIGVIGLAHPPSLITLVQRWQSPARFWFAVVIRVVLGAVLIAVAPDCRAPLVIRVVGVISIVAAVALVIVGRVRLDAFIEWWLGRPALLSVSATGAIAFGALLVYAGP